MRIVVDLDLCQGHAVCESEAPAVFAVPPGGPVRLLAPEPPEGELAAVRLAVEYCPTHALRLEEE